MLALKLGNVTNNIYLRGCIFAYGYFEVATFTQHFGSF